MFSLQLNKWTKVLQQVVNFHFSVMRENSLLPPPPMVNCTLKK
jgi:hypothetical protein